MNRLLYTFLLVFSCILVTSCTNQGTLAKVKYKNYVLEQRQAKDTFFKNSPESPLLEEQQWKFSRLSYYPVNIAYKIIAQVHDLNGFPVVIMKTSTGHSREYRAKLRLVFSFENQSLELTAFQEVKTELEISDNYFVPFTDATSGDTTYGAGRYLDIVYAGNGTTEIDFNFAYNPYCAYNYNFSCPIPPPENSLAVKVEAGELMFAE